MKLTYLTPTQEAGYKFVKRDIKGNLVIKLNSINKNNCANEDKKAFLVIWFSPWVYLCIYCNILYYTMGMDREP